MGPGWIVVELRGRGAGAGWAFFLGSLLFSGSLYAMGLGATTRLGMVTPIGGVLMIAGWVVLVRAGVRTADTPGARRVD